MHAIVAVVFVHNIELSNVRSTGNDFVDPFASCNSEITEYQTSIENTKNNLLVQIKAHIAWIITQYIILRQA